MFGTLALDTEMHAIGLTFDTQTPGAFILNILL